MSKEDETRRGPSGKRPKAGEAYLEAASKDLRTHRALRRAQMRLKAAGLALPTAASAIKLPGGLLAGLTEISAMPKALGVSATLAALLRAQNAVMDAFSRTLAVAQKEAGTGRRKAWAAALAEMTAARQKYEAEWQAETSLVPPRWRTVEELEAAIAWWQEQAAAIGIDPNRVLDAGEEVLEFEPIIKGRLRLLRLQAAAVAGRKTRKRRRRTPAEPEIRPLTEKQLEAMQIVAECKGNLAEAARGIGIDRKSLKERYEAALKKLRKAGMRKPSTQRLPVDRRGQAMVAGDDDGPAAIRRDKGVPRDLRRE